MPLINEPRRSRSELAHPSAHTATHSSAHSAHRQGEPSERADAGLTTGHQAAAQLLGLREVALPAAVVAAADLLLDDALHSEDPVTREAAAVTRGRLRAALGLH
ncbi:hypothetical protein GCM10020229_42300 [Kitasatospora albolonga]|uniref:hypothetical protein n=1 Tax=Kitasatospora albolonga TaxID=68173 RepID=UPI0031ED9EE1